MRRTEISKTNEIRARITAAAGGCREETSLGEGNRAEELVTGLLLVRFRTASTVGAASASTVGAASASTVGTASDVLRDALRGTTFETCRAERLKFESFLPVSFT